MTIFARGLLSLVGPAMVLVAAPVAAQTAPDPVGDWHGVISLPTGDVTMAIHVARGDDGALSGTIENYDQNAGNPAELSEVAASDGRLTFKVPRVNASYVGAWDEATQRWTGTLTQGQDLALNFARGRPAAKPLVEGLEGTWVGTIERNGARLRQVLQFRTVAGSTHALYSSPDQLANGLPVTGLARNGQAVTLATARGAVTFAGSLSADGTQLSGTWTAAGQPDATMTFTKASEEQLAAVRNPARPQTPRPPFPYRSEDVAFDNPAAPGVKLAGTLTLPEGRGPFPAAILLTGSGPQDRDETLLDHKPFAVLADHLTRQGFAVLRYDDRGTAQSTGNYAAAVSTDHASDANAAFAWLMTRPEVRRDAIGFIGHSEGSITGPIAMAGNDDVAYFVSLAGVGTDLVQLLLSQRRLLVSQMGVAPADIDRQEPIMRALFEAMANASTVAAGEAAAMAVLTPEAKTALGMPVEMDGVFVVRQIAQPWLQYLLKYDPVPNWSRIKVPVLALNGSLDLQVPPAANLAAIRAALKDNPDVTIVELPGLNHLFQTATTGAVGEYRDITETFAPAALDTVSDWLKQRFARR